MTATLLLRVPGAPDARHPLPGPSTAGGSNADGLLVPGLPPGALRLLPCAAGVVVEAGAPGVHVGGRPVAPGARRLLRPGEHAAVQGAELVLEALAGGEGAAEATRAAAAGLLRAAAGAAPSAAHLLVLEGAAAGARLPLGPDQTLGRSRRADLRLPEADASRLHARIRVRAGTVTVEDLGAKNGLRVNGVPIERGPRTLRAGDEVTVGGCALALVLPEPGPSPAPRPRRRRRLRPPRAPRHVAAALLALAALALAAAGS